VDKHGDRAGICRLEGLPVHRAAAVISALRLKAAQASAAKFVESLVSGDEMAQADILAGTVWRGWVD
jgi:hypothetical protein